MNIILEEVVNVLIKIRRKIFSVVWFSVYYLLFMLWMDGGMVGGEGGMEIRREGGREEEMIDGGSVDGWKGEGMVEKVWGRERGINEC